MLLCGGIDSTGRALSDCWSLHLEDMRWELVETVSPLSPMRCSLSPSSIFSPGIEDETPKQPELGRCTVTWSFSLGAAVVWCGQGFWTCRVPERQSCLASVSPQRRSAPEKIPSKAAEKLGTSKRQKQLLEQPRRQEDKGGGYSRSGSVHPPVFSGMHDVLPPPPLGFSGLPDVLPPSRHSGGHSRHLSRVQSEPRMHESWPPAPPLARGLGSQGNLLEPKGMMHGQKKEAAVQWHAKHSSSRLDTLDLL